jgi:hypothetical protein
MLFTFLILKCAAQEQQNFIGLKAGIAIPNLVSRGSGDNPLNRGYSSRLGPDVAIFWEQAITGNFSILPSIEYSSQGGKKEGFQPFQFLPEYSGFFPPGQVPTYLYADFKNDIQLNYIIRFRDQGLRIPYFYQNFSWLNSLMLLPLRFQKN